jgi:hypothetical protein
VGLSGSPTVVTPTIAANETATIIGFSLANTTASAINVSARLNKSGGASAFLVKDATVLPGGAIVIVGGDQKLVLETGDTVTSFASASNAADAVVSYLI